MNRVEVLRPLLSDPTKRDSTTRVLQDIAANSTDAEERAAAAALLISAAAPAAPATNAAQRNIDMELEALLQHAAEGPIAPDVAQIWEDLMVFRVLGGGPNFDALASARRLIGLHTRTNSALIRAEAQEALECLARAADSVDARNEAAAFLSAGRPS
jgi:hypothetical protein